MSEVKHTPGPWEINWYICTADAKDVAHAKSNGRTLSVGDEFWRVPYSIGPLSTDHNHWAGDHLAVDEANARLIAAAPDMLEALKLVIEEKAPRYHDCTDDGLPKCAWCFAEDAIAKAEGRS